VCYFKKYSDNILKQNKKTKTMNKNNNEKKRELKLKEDVSSK